jgi:addiction module HigA family antidote
MTVSNAIHPGLFIREKVLPPGLTVTAAAKQLGVGRPALSNLLNGNAALSPDMAVRLQKTFGCDSDELLRHQAAYDRAQAQVREPGIAVRAYTPSVLAIKAMQIEAWADRIDARHEFAALLRRLVYSTGEGLTQFDFPAFENAQRHGWDGFVQAEAATPWIPLGGAGWEFGVNQDPAQKAEHDYQARTTELSALDRGRLTFVFATPRRWPGKTAWAAAKAAENGWKGVRAYDASDLEQWIETSIPAQAFFAERVPLQDADLLDLEVAWRRWADAAQPPLSKSLLKSAASTAAYRLNQWLRQPPERPFTVVADSHAEGLAAIACAFEAGALEDGRARERAVVVKTPAALAKLVAATSDFIAIIDSAAVAANAADVFRRHHTIVLTHRNGVEDAADFAVDLVDDASFGDALGEMGFGHIDIERLDRESGRSLTVLRRRLAQLPALRSPPWADDAGIARRLVPLMLVGAWDAASTADQAVVEAMAAQSYDDVEATVAEWVGETDSPMWSIGRMRGVVSKTDAFYAVQHHITVAHLRRFFDVARVVLAEEDPALDLPDDQKWSAAIYGKTRRHSPTVRRSLCETLVLLSVHGGNLFRARLGFDVVGQVNALIRELLTPLDGATWQSQQHDLPRYAEAAPEVFLGLLADDLGGPTPKIQTLLRPTGPGPFSWPGRTGLLWSLEALAWNPAHLSQVVALLAKLAETKISDNWANKPEGSLDSIFRCWMPQTAAPVEARIAALEHLCRRSPGIGWRICLNQFDGRLTIGHHSARPQWRADASGAGEPVSRNEAYRMARRALDIALVWPAHDEHTLGDLVERLDGIPDDQDAVWSAIRAWLATAPSDAAKAKLREQIRRSTMVRPPKQPQEGEPPISLQAREVFDALEPEDLVWRHQWLFAQHWVQESAEELHGGDLDFRQREARIERRRHEAMEQIWKATGPDGVFQLCRLGDASTLIGALLAKILEPEELEDFAVLLAESPAEQALEQCLSGLLWSMAARARASIHELARASRAGGKRFSAEGLHRLMLRSPFGAETWSRLAELSVEEQARYWADIQPRPLFREDSDEVNQAVDELLNARRPRSAFATVHMAFSVLTTDRLVRLLTDVATVDAEPTGHYPMSPHDISKAFEVLSDRSDADEDTLARLEFLFIDGLSHTKHGIRHLERQLSSSPFLFVQALVLAFRRRDGGEDPVEVQATNTEVAQRRAQSAYALLSRARRLPGMNDKGEVDGRKLQEWIVAARALARDFGREEIADSQIGQLLAHSPPGSDGVWPHESVREVLEDLGTDRLASGMMIGRQNARGAVWRGPGGEQERTLAKTYRDWSAFVAAEYPFTARLLNELACSYDHHAAWHDDRALVEKRLHG